ncbi:L-KDR aldolase [Scheffersomyces xylosifermentans]|uniref:L-KDR aldolase n=1 Tax=Scheffersomyces xylosifermentans TaxID=1304137 RepID=UPI00315DB2F0
MLAFPKPPARGIYVPVPTFFKEDLPTIDFDTQVEHAKFLQANGITGLILLVHKEVPQLCLIGGIDQNCLQDTLEEITSLKAAGAEYALVLPSSYFGATIKQQGIIDWYTGVAENSVLPLIIYVYPGVTNNIVIEPRTIKISHGDVSHHALVGLDKDTSSNNFASFTGLGQILLPALVVGSQGTVDALAAAFPRIYIKLSEAYDKGDLKAAGEFQLVISRAEEIVVKFGVIGIKKAIKMGTGFGKTHLRRAPLNQDLDEKQWLSYLDYSEGIVFANSGV